MVLAKGKKKYEKKKKKKKKKKKSRLSPDLVKRTVGEKKQCGGPLNIRGVLTLLF